MSAETQVQTVFYVFGATHKRSVVGVGHKNKRAVIIIFFSYHRDLQILSYVCVSDFIGDCVVQRQLDCQNKTPLGTRRNRFARYVSRVGPYRGWCSTVLNSV